jgi:hypothetical protein
MAIPNALIKSGRVQSKQIPKIFFRVKTAGDESEAVTVD